MKSKQLQFADLVERVQRCNLCPRMTQRTRVLGPPNGNLDSSVVFIAEAPGRLGADKFGIPLFGDQTGRNFEWLISSAGISRDAIFITNAVLCNPRAADGKNDSPTITEIRNCSIYLEETLDIIKPKYVVPLGKMALTALRIIDPIEIELSESVGQIFPWNGYQVYPLYHPGPRTFIWRPKAQQVKDYEKLGELLARNKEDTVSGLSGSRR
jgi:uracil-DNA glycosylase family 4